MFTDFEVVKSVTRPVLKIEGQPVFFTVQDIIKEGKALEGTRARANADGNVMAPPQLMDVLDLATNQDSVVVVNTVLKSELEEKYPRLADDTPGYLGKSFRVIKHAPAGGGKRYATFEITEIRPKAKAAEPAPEPTPAAETATVQEPTPAQVVKGKHSK